MRRAWCKTHDTCFHFVYMCVERESCGFFFNIDIIRKLSKCIFIIFYILLIMAIYCPDCGKELINSNAEICPNCGGRLKPAPSTVLLNQKNPIVSAVLSAIVVGLGQIYNGQLGKGVAYFIIGVICGILILVLVGIILVPIWWVVGIVDAYKTAVLINANKDASKFFNFS